jgi:hypothetical protein
MGAGHDTLADFQPGKDHLAVPRAAYVSPMAVLVALDLAPAGIWLPLGEEGGVLLVGLVLSELSASDIFVA